MKIPDLKNDYMTYKQFRGVATKLVVLPQVKNSFKTLSFTYYRAKYETS